MDPREAIEALVAFEGRWAGSDAERRAARHLSQTLGSLGRGAELEQTRVWPNYHLAHAIHAILAILGSAVSVSKPGIGAALAGAAVVLAFGDATGTFLVTRRLLGWRASQNVVSTEDAGKPGALVLVAHYDAARSGAVFSRPVEERRAALGGLLRRPIGLFEPFFWSLALVLLCCLVRLPGLEGVALTAVQFVPTVVLIFSIPLLVDIALSDVVPGANDNASGVATARRLVDRYGGSLEYFDVWALFTGAQEPFALGLAGFLRRHRGSLPKDRTVFLNLDEVGSGTVRYTRREGLVLGVRSHVQLVELCDDIAEDDQEAGAFGARALVSRTASDAYAARLRGFPAVTVTCRNALGYAPEHHRPTDTPDRIDDRALERAYGFCCELIDRIDAQLGPELEGAVLAEEEAGA
jgi:Peptidase family M28